MMHQVSTDSNEYLWVLFLKAYFSCFFNCQIFDYKNATGSIIVKGTYLEEIIYFIESKDKEIFSSRKIIKDTT